MVLSNMAILYQLQKIIGFDFQYINQEIKFILQIIS